MDSADYLYIYEKRHSYDYYNELLTYLYFNYSNELMTTTDVSDSISKAVELHNSIIDKEKYAEGLFLNEHKEKENKDKLIESTINLHKNWLDSIFYDYPYINYLHKY